MSVFVLTTYGSSCKASCNGRLHGECAVVVALVLVGSGLGARRTPCGGGWPVWMTAGQSGGRRHEGRHAERSRVLLCTWTQTDRELACVGQYLAAP